MSSTTWRFLYGPPQPTGGWVGEFAQAQSRTLTLRPGPTNYHQAVVNINGRDLAAASVVELQNDMQVLYGGQIVFAGRIVPSEDDLDASQHRTILTAVDYREVLRRRAVYTGQSWTSKEQATIAWNIVQATQALSGGNLGITQGAGTATGVTRTYNNVAGDMCGADIDTLAQMDAGFDWDITPYGKSDLRLDIFYPQRGVNRGVVLQYGDALVASVKRQVDPSAYADAVYVTGASSKSLTPGTAAASDIATRPEGRWDQVIGTNLQTQSSLNSATAWYLSNAEVITPTYSVVLNPGVWQGPGHIWMGDTVQLIIKSGRLNVNASYVVSELDFDISPDGLETLTLTLGPIPFRLKQKIPAMLRRLRDLELR